MEKLLTISIAAYNMEDYIVQTLDSLISSKYIDKLEIFVIDDGGVDKTIEITKDYQNKFPSSVFPIKKQNEGYGSTVNYSLKNATGKYFKLLDGDDWFNTEEFDNLLQKLQEIDTDIIITPFFKGEGIKQGQVLVDFDTIFKNNEEVLISSLEKFGLIGMWAICYKTDILRLSKLELPQKLFYTDQLFCTIPFVSAKTIRYINNPVYFYRVGRDGQSVSRESRIKNKQMTLDICQMLVSFLSQSKDNSSYNYMLHRVSSYYQSALKTILLSPIDKNVINDFIKYENIIKNISMDVFEHSSKFGKIGRFLKFIRFTNYKGLYILKVLYPDGLRNWA